MGGRGFRASRILSLCPPVPSHMGMDFAYLHPWLSLGWILAHSVVLRPGWAGSMGVKEERDWATQLQPCLCQMGRCHKRPPGERQREHPSISAPPHTSLCPLSVCFGAKFGLFIPSLLFARGLEDEDTPGGIKVPKGPSHSTCGPLSSPSLFSIKEVLEADTEPQCVPRSRPGSTWDPLFLISTMKSLL